MFGDQAKCFQGTNVLADMLVFIFVPVVMERFAHIVDATVNSRTGQRLFSGFTTGEFKTKGRTRNPDTGETLDNEDSSGKRNPLFEFSLADNFEQWVPTPGSETCAACFNCKASPTHGSRA